MVKELDAQEVEEIYEIDLKQYNLKVFYEKIVESVSRNMGWMNYQKAIFDIREERDYCLFELESNLGIRGLEVLKFKGAAKDLYNALRSAFPNIDLSEKSKMN